MLYKLFSAVHRCMPCQMLVLSLEREFPEWKQYVEYVEADSMSDEQRQLATELRVMRLPTFTDNVKIIELKGSPIQKAKQIKGLCLTKE